MKFEDILNLLEPSEQEVLNQVVAKQPQLKQGWMRQDDYSRRLDEFRAKETNFSEISSYAQNWSNWYKENWDEENDSTRAEVALKARVQELEASKGEEVTFDQINAHLESQGLVKKADLEAKEKIFGEHLQGSAYVGAMLAKLGTRHMLEFKEEFDAPDLLIKANQYGMSDLDQVYNRVVEDRRKEKNEEALKVRIAEAEKAAREAGRKEAVEGLVANNGGSVLPVNDSSNDLGHFQRRILGLNPDKTMPEGRSVAQWAAEKYREDQLNRASA